MTSRQAQAFGPLATWISLLRLCCLKTDLLFPAQPGGYREGCQTVAGGRSLQRPPVKRHTNWFAAEGRAGVRWVHADNLDHLSKDKFRDPGLPKITYPATAPLVTPPQRSWR